MSNLQEIWKQITGYEDLYEVSNLGRVRSVRGRLLSQNKDPSGYMKINLSRFGTHKLNRIHRLVAAHFISNPLNKVSVNHKDGNKLNNHVDNLEWNTWKENSDHAIRTGLNKQRYDVSKR